MDRQTVYYGQIPLETDQLKQSQNAMVALAKFAAGVLGPTTIVNGFTCLPTTPASLNVNLSAGEIYQLENLEQSTWSSLSADTHTILKQGMLLDPMTISIVPPATTGYSQVYLIEVQYQDLDSGSLVLPYYNAANPSLPFSGPGNAGTAQNTVRKGIVAVQAKAGIAAPTGTQTTPSADAGWTGLFAITVANGASTITSGNIAQISSAPFIPTTLPNVPSDAQSGKWVYGRDTGTVNAMVVTLNPVPAMYVEGMGVNVKVLNNNTGATTINVNGLGAKSIVRSDGSILNSKDLVAGMVASLRYDGSNFQLVGSQPGVLTASRSYYINPDTGSDTANDGLTSGAPFKTIQKALSIITTFNMNGYSVTLHCADSVNYTPFGSVPLNGSGNVFIFGNLTSPQNCVIHSTTSNYTATGACAYFSHQGYIFAGFTHISDNLASVGVSPSGFGIRAGAGAAIALYNHVFGACYGQHVSAENAANILIYGNQNAAQVGVTVTWKITGGAANHFQTEAGASLSMPFGTDLVVGAAVTFGGSFVTSIDGWFYGFFNSITGSAVTGVKYSAILNGIINSNGSGTSHFPGTVAGTTASGGQYA